MKRALNGFQCDFCHTIYKRFSDAAKCEDTSMETPLLEIGDVVIDDGFEVEAEFRVCGISFNGHEVNYRMEWQIPNGNEEWVDVSNIYGNKMLLEYYELPNKV